MKVKYIHEVCMEIIRFVLRIPIKVLDWKRKRDDWDQDKPEQEPSEPEELK